MAVTVSLEMLICQENHIENYFVSLSLVPFMYSLLLCYLCFKSLIFYISVCLYIVAVNEQFVLVFFFNKIVSRRGLYDETGEVDDENDPLSQEIIFHSFKTIVF